MKKNGKIPKKGVDQQKNISNMCASIGSLAQLVEQLAFNQLVDGSNPSRPTKFRTAR